MAKYFPDAIAMLVRFMEYEPRIWTSWRIAQLATGRVPAARGSTRRRLAPVTRCSDRKIFWFGLRNVPSGNSIKIHYSG